MYEKKTNRTKLKIVESYWERGKVKQKMVRNLGYLDELEKKFVNPIAHFKAVAKQMAAEKNQANKKVQVMVPVHSTLTRKETLSPEQYTRKNIGYGALSMLYQ